MRNLTLSKALKIRISKSNEELAIFTSSDNQSTSEMQIIEHFEKLIGNRLDAKELLRLHGGIMGYYVYLI